MTQAARQRLGCIGERGGSAGVCHPSSDRAHSHLRCRVVSGCRAERRACRKAHGPGQGKSGAPANGVHQQGEGQIEELLVQHACLLQAALHRWQVLLPKGQAQWAGGGVVELLPVD